MLNIVLFEPEIPPNTGNLIRLCANAGFTLHLIHPLGFRLEDKRLRRAGLDYAELTSVVEYRNWQDFEESGPAGRRFACTTKGRTCYADVRYKEGDVLLFGPESRGLPAQMLGGMDEESKIRIPMQSGSRSLNLANAVSIIAFEAWRQMDFAGAQ
ncbi:tRNA (cytidine(34)-2'-O)-methyltransferase [Granulosicoccaceae sp. 1_MG-2023]|nr:tRNA (cytidine(34)-2'-O)-methyltransferase [Granulosicoccaceae sp. 1_MG-2023]